MAVGYGDGELLWLWLVVMVVVLLWFFLLQWVVVAMVVMAGGMVGEVAVCRFFGCFFNIIFMSCLYCFR